MGHSLYRYAAEFDDGARKFVGREGFTNHTYVADYVTDAKAAVESMAGLYELKSADPSLSLKVPDLNPVYPDIPYPDI
jgi:hypothetical protein